MFLSRPRATLAAAGLTLCALSCAAGQAAGKPARPLNVLFLVVDDLRPILGCYGDDRVKSPRIDSLAAQGIRFDRGYCQYALCNPSRSSLLAGRRPETLEIFTLAKFVRTGHPDVVTLPEHFKSHGYETRSYGKIFHVTNGNHDDPQSWSRPPWPERKAAGEPASLAQDTSGTAARAAAPPSITADHSNDDAAESPDVADDALLDGRIAAQAVAALGELRAKPFFLAVGFHKPHLPFIAPKRYWDLYDRSEFPLPEDDKLPQDAPAFASNDSSELRRYKGVPQSGPPVSAAEASRLIHGYHACVSYTDAQVGRVLDELERLEIDDHTVVVLFGDHGYHLAEKGTWTKRTAWELATRVPLVIRLPQQIAAGGAATDALVELLDLYPTLTELCGLPTPSGLEGRSLAPLLHDPTTDWPHVARSVITRTVPELGKGMVTGRAIRTPRYRWVEWTGGPVAEPIHELYDHATDPLETVNIAASPAGQRVIDELRTAHGNP
jgi:iduronate 2-sulfatase